MLKQEVVLKETALRELAARRGMSLEKLASVAGITKATLMRWLNGTREPSPIGRTKLLKATRLTFDDLFEIRMVERTEETDGTVPAPLQ